MWVGCVFSIVGLRVCGFGFMVIRCGFAWVGLLGRLLFGACVDWRVGTLCSLF